MRPQTSFCTVQSLRHRKDIHSHIHSHPPMHTPKTNREQNPQQQSIKLGNTLCCLFFLIRCRFSCPTWWLAKARSFADAPQDCSTSEAFSPRTVLTENICKCVQHTLQHFQTTMPFLTTSTITFSCLASAAPQADSW